MGQAKLPKDVKLMAGIMFKSEADLSVAKTTLENWYGPIETESEIFDFIHSEYYADEMGLDLKKQFVIFKNLIRPEQISDIKLKTNELEQSFLKNGNRQVNVDPGYITAAKLVLATTKNYMHRIYLRDGIFADVHLKVSNRRFVPNEWTYPDYQTPEALAFFNQVRRAYMNEV
jgi:hypothetical protein